MLIASKGLSCWASSLAVTVQLDHITSNTGTAGQNNCFVMNSFVFKTFQFFIALLASYLLPLVSGFQKKYFSHLMQALQS